MIWLFLQVFILPPFLVDDEEDKSQRFFDYAKHHKKQSTEKVIRFSSLRYYLIDYTTRELLP